MLNKFRSILLLVFLILLLLPVANLNAEESKMYLLDCVGKETGKVKGWISKIQMLLDCTGIECKVKLGDNYEFLAKFDSEGRLSAQHPNNFEFYPDTGEVQGRSWPEPVSQYFFGKCKKS